MPEFRYPQFCAVARAAEIVGERWTILILRELLFGPQRFSDLRKNLSQVSPSVLTERLACLEAQGLARREELPPPAASTVYVATDLGRTFGPVLAALARFGTQFLLPPRDGEQLDPDRLLFMLGLYARKTPTLPISSELRIAQADGTPFVIHICGGAAGTVVEKQTVPPKPSHVVLHGSALDIVRRITSPIAPSASGPTGATNDVRIEGDESVVARIAELFELGPPTTERDSTGQPTVSTQAATDTDNQGATK